MASGIRYEPRPGISREDVDNVLKHLELDKVRDWSENDVSTNFLIPLGFNYCSEVFIENRITGPVLLSLTDSHLKELGVMLLGDRIMFLEYASILQKKKIQQERAATLWEGTTPYISCAYSDNCCQCLFRYFCRCCVAKVSWRVTPQGLRYTSYPAPCKFLGNVERDFIDFRFLKDLEVRTSPGFLCCCRGHSLVIYADDSDSNKDGEPLYIQHPEALQVEEAIRNSWAEARLVD